jgi:hypothetical protein
MMGGGGKRLKPIEEVLNEERGCCKLNDCLLWKSRFGRGY